MKCMKTMMLSFGLVLLSVCMLAVPSPASAQSTGGTATDCTNGCVLYTCKSGKCTVWHCSGAQGCVVVGSFQQLASERVRSAQASEGLQNGAVFAKICKDGSRCELIKLTTTAAVNLGSFDDLDGVVHRLQMQGG